MVGSEGFLSFLETCCQQVFGRAGNWGAGNFPFPLLAIFFPEQRACSQAKFLGKMKFQVRCRRGLYRLTRGGFLISLSRRIKVYLGMGGGGYLRNWWGCVAGSLGHPQPIPELVQVNFATLYLTKLPKFPPIPEQPFSRNYRGHKHSPAKTKQI